MAKSLAVELAPCIRVNAIAPGNIATEWVSDLGSEEREQAAREALLQRLGDPEDIANLLVFLASEDSSFINGQTIIVDGGAVVR
jgi:NAD(P)-dependent dehydrogenase (short-subunit alcohol dehydrogenase family)